MFVDIKQFWWAVPFSVAGLPAFFAIYYGLAAMAARKMGLRGVKGSLSFGVMWFLAEYVRGHLFTGFPWNLTGYSFSGVLPVLQITSIIGIYGLTLITCISASLPASLASKEKTARAATILGALLIAVISIGGAIRLSSITTEMTPEAHIRLVQPNIPQTNKWKNSEREKGFQTLLDLTSETGEKTVTHVFWPETASTYYLGEDAFRRQQIADAISSSTSVITGVIRRAQDENGNLIYYNSIVAINGMGNMVAGYDKAHLVPFGEYMPFRKALPLRALAASDADFTAGKGARSLRILGLPLFSPLVCYEAIFPGNVVDQTDRPDFLLNATNDAWYGNTTGPYQHFEIARVRAIEEGLPLARVANTGISGVTDPVGRVVKKLGLGEKGFIDSALPKPLPPTMFSMVGEYPIWLFILAFFLYLSFEKREKLLSILRNKRR